MQLSQALKGVIPDSLLPFISNRYEVVGDIAVISFPDQLSPYQTDIAESIISMRRNITTVLRRVSKREGSRRVAGYEPIIGSKMKTTCRESGFLYRVNLSHAFFTTRLAGERQRITAMVQPGETILVPFAGVGPFVIPAAARGARVIAVEKNPDACLLLQENIRINHLTCRVMVIRGNALFTDQMFGFQVDRTIIPTPYGFDETFWPISRVVKPGGDIHFYTFHNQCEAEFLSQRFQDSGFQVSRMHRCGNVAPSVNRWVFDLKRPALTGDRYLNIFTGCE